MSVPSQAFRKLTGFLKSLGVKAVFDTSCSRDLSLLESCEEFVDRYKRTGGNSGTQQGDLPMLASACPGELHLEMNSSHPEVVVG